MLDIALATSREYPELDEDSVPLLDALRSRGLRCEPRVWDSGFDPAGARMCLIRSTWDYDSRREEFLSWARKTSDSTVLIPSLETVAWNTDKRYLQDLEARGVELVPTAWLAHGERLADVMQAPGWERAVMKPAVAAGSRGLTRISLDGAAGVQSAADALLERGAVLVQPFLASVETEGELSLLYADGKLTHAVRKRPRTGDFRVQPEYGGTFALEEPGASELEAARTVLAALDEIPPVARVDLVTGDAGEALLMELELIEPRLFLRAAPDAAARYASAVAKRVRLST